MSVEAKDLVKKVRGQIARRYIDASMINISITGGTVYLTGVLHKLRTAPNIDLKIEMEQIGKILRTVPGVREVIWDVTQRT